ncbi:hypothetical protein B0H21DRAFT_693224 [Amylocystis lapponica]|nr:hypothetical protein B0H21DRAFT_693224 [Amylocystis lapponica]
MPETEFSIGLSVYDGLQAVQKAPIDVALEALSELGYKNLTKADLERLHPPDDFEEELEVMADVRAYFQVSYKRIIDNVPMTIQHTLNRALAQAMQNCLVAELHLGTSDASERLEKLLVEDPGIEAKRMELEKKRARLLEIQVKLINFHLPV